MVDNVERQAPLKAGEKLFRFLAGLLLEKFYGTVTIRFEAGKVTHVEAETRRMWPYRDLPEVLNGREDRSTTVSPEDGRAI